MTEPTLLEQTVNRIAEEALVHSRSEDIDLPWFKQDVAAILTQYTEAVISPMEVTEEWYQCGCGEQHLRSYEDRENRNDLRSEQRTRAGLSHGEKETL